MGEEKFNLEKTIETIIKLDKWKSTEKSITFTPPDLTSMSNEEIADYVADLKAGKRRNFLDGFASLWHSALLQVSGGYGHLSLPVPTLAERAVEASKTDFNILKQKIEDVGFDIESIDKAIIRYNEQYRLDKPKPDWETDNNAYPTSFHIGPPHNITHITARNPTEFDEITKEAKENVIILSEAKKFTQAVLSVYEKELQKRKSEVNPEEMINKAKSICDGAIKASKNVISAHTQFAKNETSEKMDMQLKSARKFAESLAIFDALQSEYDNIRHSLQHGVSSDEIKKLLPTFPPKPTLAETPRKTQIDYLLSRMKNAPQNVP